MDGSRIAAVGTALADETRSMVLAALMSGTAHTAGELARCCRVAPSTMSDHLARLRDVGLVAVEPAGRYRFYRIANHEVADLLEHIDSIDLPEVAPLQRPRATSELGHARSCYDHIAGTLGVHIFDVVRARGLVVVADQQPQLTATGLTFFEQLGIDVATVIGDRRPTVRCCLDWTERRHHLGGGLGAALLDLSLRERWLVRDRDDQRILRLTASGRMAFERQFG